MRCLAVFFLALPATVLAGEQRAFPLWNGHESVADYAREVNLPATQALDLGNSVKLELVLIPAGKFEMGTPAPTPVDEDGFRGKIITSQALLAASGFVLLALLCAVIVIAIRKRQRPKYSLLWLLAMTGMAGVALMSGLHWRKSARELDAARTDFAAATARYKAASQDEKPVHAVTLTQPFYIGKYPVTLGQFEQATGAPWDLSIGRYRRPKDCPVEGVPWDRAQEFCRKLTEQMKQTVRLPTEAEWEYSCRAGTRTAYYSGDTGRDLDRVAWHHENSRGNRSLIGETHPVGLKAPNAFGLFDMHGNVYQWCQDWFGDDYYSKSPTDDPGGPAEGSDRVLRGGSWLCSPNQCRSGYRGSTASCNNGNDIGFRVVVNVPAQ